MYLFKQRLEELISHVIFIAILVAVLCGVFWIVDTLSFVGVILYVLIIGGMVLGLVCLFLYWLFIEPFLDSELYWKIKAKLKRK